MKENLQNIAIKKLGSIYVPSKEIKFGNQIDQTIAFQIQSEAMKLGCIFTEDAINCFVNNISIYDDVFQSLNILFGNDKAWKPMYKNFPNEVFEKSETELYLNAITHYWSSGLWMPPSDQTRKVSTFEKISFKKIGVIDKYELKQLFVSILNSNGSITEYDKTVIEFAVDNNLIDSKNINISFKETLCYFVCLLFRKGFELKDIKNSIKSATDVLRIATELCGGDISLLENTKFKLKNQERKFIVSLLEPVINEYDVSRHSNKWLHLFHCLHINTFKSAERSRKIAYILRNQKISRPNTKIEKALINKDKETIISELSKNPGEFGRRLDHILRTFDGGTIIPFFANISKIDTRVLIQMLSHFKYRNEREYRIVIPKGSTKKSFLLSKNDDDIPKDTLNFIVNNIERELEKRFKTKEFLGRVYIDEILKKSPIPMQMRTASDGLLVMQRGSRLNLAKDKSVLRFFINWIGNDIDLSAAFLDENLNYIDTIAYYNLKNTNGYKSAHSGDITYAPAPNGACEFIDIDLNSITDTRIHYIAMDVRVYSGAQFPKQSANAGWMMRDEVSASRSEIFDPRTVEQRIVLTSGKTAIVALFDIINREVIWMDCEGQSNQINGGNNVESNKPSIIQLSKMMVHLKQMSLYDLLKIHAQNRGHIVEKKEHADIIFDQSYVFKHTEILSNYL